MAVKLNVALKVAIVESRKRSADVARLAKIHDTRLSQILNGRVRANESERLRLAGVLQRSVDELFTDISA